MWHGKEDDCIELAIYRVSYQVPIQKIYVQKQNHVRAKWGQRDNTIRRARAFQHVCVCACETARKALGGKRATEIKQKQNTT